MTIVAQPVEAGPGQPLETLELGTDGRLAETGQPVRPPPVDRLERFDEAAPFQPGQRAVQRAGPHGDPVSASTSVMIA